MFIESIPNSVKILLLTILVGGIIFIILPKDICGNVCGGYSNSPIPLLILSSMFGISFLICILSIISRLKKKIPGSALTGISIFFIFSIFITFMLWIWGLEVRCQPRWERTIAKMNYLRQAQEIFHIQYNRYAETQEELIEANILSTKAKDWVTNIELADKYGQGIGGGDGNPQTWSVTTHIPKRKIDKWCRLTEAGYWYVCDQLGCHKEAELLVKEEKVAEKYEIFDWMIYENKEYGFNISYPKEWTLKETKMGYEVLFKEFTIHKIGKDPEYKINVPYIRISPGCFPISLPDDININRLKISFAGGEATASRFLTEEGEIWLEIVSNISNSPGIWDEKGYIKISPKSNLETKCAIQPPPEDYCGYGVGRIYFGEVDQDDWELLNQILSTFRFLE